MTLTSSGPKCDVCGKYIFGLIPGDRIYPFSIDIIKQELHSCYECKPKMLNHSGNWKELPEGPLKEHFRISNLKLPQITRDGEVQE